MCTTAAPFEIVTSPALVDTNAKAAFGVLLVKHTDAAVIAKWVREDIARAQKFGAFAGLKIAVRIKRASMCREINVVITAATGAVFNMGRLAAYAVGEHNVGDYSPRIARALRLLEIVLCQYAFDESDSQSDYYNVNFWPHVGVDHEVESADREPRARAAMLAIVRDMVATVDARGALTDDRPALACEALTRGDRAEAYNVLDGCDDAALRPLKIALRAAAMVGKHDNIFDATKSIHSAAVAVFSATESEHAARARVRNHLLAA